MDYAIDSLNSDVYCTMQQALKHLRLDAYDSTGALEVDQVTIDEVQTMIDSAITQVENLSGVILGTRAFELTVSEIKDKLIIPFYKVLTITSIQYYNRENVLTTLPETSYRLSSYITRHESLIYVKGVFPDMFEDTFILIKGTCGTATIPADIKKAVRLLIGDSDTYREDRNIPGTERAVYALMRPYKQ